MTAPNRTPANAALEAHWHRHGWVRAMHHTVRFAEMANALDASQLDEPVPDSDWTVRQVVAHVASVWRRYTVNRERADTAAAVAIANAEDIATIGTDVAELTRDMCEQMASLESVIDLVEPSTLFDFHAGQQLTLAGGWGNAISELLVHGDDIARATCAVWSVDADDLEPMWRFATRVLPGFLSEEGRRASDRWDLDFGFDSGPVRIRFDLGTLTVDDPDPWTPDHVVTGDPVITTLTVPWRRRPTSDPELTILRDRFVVV